jgi:hypothetical protein
MVDIAGKLDVILAMVAKGKYFIINRPRQYGKTTTLFLLEKRLLKAEEYLPVAISFEGIGSESYSGVKSFVEAFLTQIKKALLQLKASELVKLLEREQCPATMAGFDQLLTMLNSSSVKKVALLIDEVDKSCNNQSFLDFLGLLRNKYLLQSTGKDITFHSVILAGVHDVKTLKLKLRPDDARKYNSPWNIAADFKVDLSFSAVEIASMLGEYEKDHRTGMDITALSDEIYKYSGGYPFLVSYRCGGSG